MPYFIEISTYHRLVSPSQTLEDIGKQVQSLEIWGKPARNLYPGATHLKMSDYGKLIKKPRKTRSSIINLVIIT